ncbi:hypothetical protein Q3G72_029754 [Acer saccharum]|nr:hypothetical protein Q3G72_029754 [Acer saccharum]
MHAHSPSSKSSDSSYSKFSTKALVFFSLPSNLASSLVPIRTPLMLQVFTIFINCSVHYSKLQTSIFTSHCSVHYGPVCKKENQAQNHALIRYSLFSSLLLTVFFLVYHDFTSLRNPRDRPETSTERRALKGRDLWTLRSLVHTKGISVIVQSPIWRRTGGIITNEAALFHPKTMIGGPIEGSRQREGTCYL